MNVIKYKKKKNEKLTLAAKTNVSFDHSNAGKMKIDANDV